MMPPEGVQRIPWTLGKIRDTTISLPPVREWEIPDQNHTLSAEIPPDLIRITGTQTFPCP
jgi:hypothetical protein